MNPILFYDTFYVGVHEVPHKDSHSIHFTVQMADACSPITRQRNALLLQNVEHFRPTRPKCSVQISISHMASVRVRTQHTFLQVCTISPLK